MDGGLSVLPALTLGLHLPLCSGLRPCPEGASATHLCPLICHAEAPIRFISAIPLTAYGPMAAAAAAAAVVRGTGKASWGAGSEEEGAEKCRGEGRQPPSPLLRETSVHIHSVLTNHLAGQPGRRLASALQSLKAGGGIGC